MLAIEYVTCRTYALKLWCRCWGQQPNMHQDLCHSTGQRRYPKGRGPSVQTNQGACHNCCTSFSACWLTHVCLVLRIQLQCVQNFKMFHVRRKAVCVQVCYQSNHRREAIVPELRDEVDGTVWGQPARCQYVFKWRGHPRSNKSHHGTLIDL